MRTGGLDDSAALALRSGSMASSNGNASVAPTPRRTIRREMGKREVVMSSPVGRSRNATEDVPYRGCFRPTISKGHATNNLGDKHMRTIAAFPNLFDNFFHRAEIFHRQSAS